jgi:xylulokinase
MPEYLLGIDVGTTGTKGILLHPEKGIVAEATAPATLHAPRPGWAEGDPTEWWGNVGRVTKACVSQAGPRRWPGSA